MVDKKVLRQQYKQMKKDMGIYSFTCLATGKVYVGWAQDLRGKINGARARLDGDLHACRNLQEDWNRYGPQGFRIKTEELLEYDQDETKTDYREDLEVLLAVWLKENERKYPETEGLK